MKGKIILRNILWMIKKEDKKFMIERDTLEFIPNIKRPSDSKIYYKQGIDKAMENYCDTLIETLLILLLKYLYFFLFLRFLLNLHKNFKRQNKR